MLLWSWRSIEHTLSIQKGQIFHQDWFTNLCNATAEAEEKKKDKNNPNAYLCHASFCQTPHLSELMACATPQYQVLRCHYFAQPELLCTEGHCCLLPTCGTPIDSRRPRRNMRKMVGFMSVRRCWVSETGE